MLLAGKSPNIRSYTVYIYGPGQPYLLQGEDTQWCLEREVLLELWSIYVSRNSYRSTYLYLAPAIRAPMSKLMRRVLRSISGTSPRTMRCARPSTHAVCEHEQAKAKIWTCVGRVALLYCDVEKRELVKTNCCTCGYLHPVCTFFLQKV